MGSGLSILNFLTILSILYLYMYIYRDNLSNEGVGQRGVSSCCGLH